VPQPYPLARSQSEQRRPSLNQPGEASVPGLTMNPNSMNPPPLVNLTHQASDVPPGRSDRSSSHSLPAASQPGYTYVMNPNGPSTQVTLQIRPSAAVPTQTPRPGAPHRRSQSTGGASYEVNPISYDQRPNQAQSHQTRAVSYQDNRVPVGWTQPSPVRTEMSIQGSIQPPRHHGLPNPPVDHPAPPLTTQSAHPNLTPSSGTTLLPGVSSQPTSTRMHHHSQKPLVPSPTSSLPMSPIDGHASPQMVVPVNYDDPTAQAYFNALYYGHQNGTATCRFCGYVDLDLDLEQIPEICYRRNDHLPPMNFTQLFNHSVAMHRSAFDAVHIAIRNTKASS
jgi:hypothetical protein